MYCPKVTNVHRKFILPIIIHEPYNSMQQNISWDTKSSLASKEIPHFLWNLKVHSHVHNSPLLDSILSHIIPLQALILFNTVLVLSFIRIHFNIILPSPPRVSKRSLTSFPIKIPHAFVFSPMSSICYIHLIILYLITQIIFGKEYKLQSSKLRLFLQSRAISYFSGSGTFQHPVPKPPPPSKYFSLQKPSKR